MEPNTQQGCLGIRTLTGKGERGGGHNRLAVGRIWKGVMWSGKQEERLCGGGLDNGTAERRRLPGQGQRGGQRGWGHVFAGLQSPMTWRQTSFEELERMQKKAGGPENLRRFS